MSDDKPKSAIEIAMERLRGQDAAAGIEQKPVSDEQKAALAEVRSYYEAQLAQLKVMQEAALRRTFDPAERNRIDETHQRDRERLIADRDAKIERLRRGDAGS